jgi:hypothetical protein
MAGAITNPQPSGQAKFGGDFPSGAFLLKDIPATSQIL